MLGSIISAVGNIAGGIFNAKKQEKFAKNAIQWKAADAEKAGISKYFAMGAPTSSFAPVSVGDVSGFGAALDKQMERGNQAQSTTTGKFTGIGAEIQRAQLDGLRIDNDIKRAELQSKINLATQPGAGHMLDRDVSTDASGVKFEKKVAPAGSSPQKEFGVSPEVSMYRTKDGYAPQIPQQLQEAFESDALSRWQWNIRNKLGPYLSLDKFGTIPHAADPGMDWLYDPLTGEYIQIPKHVTKPRNRHEGWRYLMQQLRR